MRALARRYAATSWLVALVALVALAGALIVASGCRTPTQVTVTIRTDVPCPSVRTVQLTVGPSPEATEKKVASYITTSTRQCDHGLVGTLVVTPGGDRAAIVVVAQLTDEQCTPPDYKGCIVGRRSFNFIDHVALDIPIDLDLDCANKPCDKDNTCKKGLCVESSLRCEDDGTCTGEGMASDSDGGPLDASIDATLPNDAGIDTGTDATIPVADARLDAMGNADSGAGCGPGTPPNTCCNTKAFGKCGSGSCGGTQFCCHPYAEGGIVDTSMCLNNGDYCPGAAACCNGTDCGGDQCCVSDLFSSALSTRISCFLSGMPCRDQSMDTGRLCTESEAGCQGSCQESGKWLGVKVCDVLP